MKVKRTDRLNSELRKDIYEVIKNRLVIPGVTEMFTITEVDVSPDLKNARVYVSVYSTDEVKAKATLDGIKNASSDIRRELASMMHTRSVPELRFYYDGASAYGNKIESILANITYGENDDDGGNND